ncbi:unnamed protein product, partial [Nesidiocoris tenuis]
MSYQSDLSPNPSIANTPSDLLDTPINVDLPEPLLGFSVVDSSASLPDVSQDLSASRAGKTKQTRAYFPETNSWGTVVRPDTPFPDVPHNFSFGRPYIPRSSIAYFPDTRGTRSFAQTPPSLRFLRVSRLAAPTFHNHQWLTSLTPRQITRSFAHTPPSSGFLRTSRLVALTIDTHLWLTSPTPTRAKRSFAQMPPSLTHLQASRSVTHITTKH